MKKLYCFAALTLLSFSLFTQTNDCSMQEIPEMYRNYMIETGQFVQQTASSRQGATRDIALNLILVVYDDGPLVTPQFVQQKVDSANVIYSPIGIRFQICSIRYVDYPGYLSFIPGYITWSNEIEAAVLEEGYLPGYFNIIYGSGAGPNATLPGIYYGDRVLMNAGPNRVFVHEIGHYFSLWHTHAFNGYSTNIYTLELVDGSNCETEGDFICDTPADPGLYGRASAFPDCQYTDTVSTDANGDLYQPDVNNYMSAAPPGCQIQFTQGQYDRMTYALYHERAVLKTGQAGVTMHEIPMKMCITDDPVALSSDIPGGVFSGNGVTGNFFDPALAGPGNHIITYTANTTEEVVETTDQFCAYHDTAFSSGTIWQSFTAEIEGLLTGMAFSLQAAEASSVHYSILEGSGTGGNLIDEGDFTVETGEGFDWVRFNPGTEINLTAGQQITVVLNTTNNLNYGAMRTEFYAGGSGTNGKDFSFISYVLPEQPLCGNTTKTMVSVGEATPVSQDVLLPVYCKSAPESEISFLPAGGTVTIDGFEGNLIDPAELEPGMHEAAYQYSNTFGCLVEEAFMFEIGHQLDLNLADNSSFCMSDSLLYPASSAEGGIWILDGQEAPELPIDLQSLSSGNHELSYVKTEDYPWLKTIDQHWEPVPLSPQWAINSGSTIWQSFTPSVDGYINRFDFGVYTTSLINCDFALYEGTGTEGNLIYSQSTTTGPHSIIDVRPFYFPEYQILLRQDSVYTFAFSVGSVSSLFAYAHFDTPYTRGTSSYSTPNTEVSIRFQEVINPLIPCSADTVTAHFQVVEDFIVDLGPDLIVNEGETVTLDAGNAGNFYLWSTGETSQTIEVDLNSDAQIWVEVFNEAGCSGSDTLEIHLITNLTDVVSTSASLDLFPNPAEGSVFIRSNFEISELRLFDVSGKLVLLRMLKNSAETPYKLNTEALGAGVYFIKAIGKNATKTARLIIK